MRAGAGIELTGHAVEHAATALEATGDADLSRCLSLTAPGSEVVIAILERVDELSWALRASLRQTAASLADRVRRIGVEFDALDGALAGAP